MHRIIICSKDRPNGKTFELLGDLPYTVLIEPQDAPAYIERFKGKNVNLVLLNESNQGLAYCRQAALNYARTELTLDKWYWLLDDDITGFYVVVNGKTVRTEAENALEIAETLMRTHGVQGQAGLEYQQFAWSAKKSVAWSSYCDVAVCINSAMPVNYRKVVDLKCDRDYTLQLLSYGFNVLKLCHVAFSAPKNGSNQGGLHEAYKTTLEAEHSAKMVELWPGVCTPHVKKDGRPDVKINWKAFNIKNGKN